MNSSIRFADKKIHKAFLSLKESKDNQDRDVYKWILRAIDDLKNNSYCGIQIPKRLIPKEYIKKYGLDNLWKYDMPKGWRLVYTVVRDEVLILSVILEWFDHKNYERRFKY